MREEAYKGCLLAELAQEGLRPPAARATWLVPRVTGIGTGHASDWVPGMTGEKTPEVIRNAAMLRLLSEQGPEALAVVRSALVEAPDDDYERVEALARVIIMICRTQSTSAEPGIGDQ